MKTAFAISLALAYLAVTMGIKMATIYPAHFPFPISTFIGLQCYQCVWDKNSKDSEYIGGIKIEYHKKCKEGNLPDSIAVNCSNSTIIISAGTRKLLTLFIKMINKYVLQKRKSHTTPTS